MWFLKLKNWKKKLCNNVIEMLKNKKKAIQNKNMRDGTKDSRRKNIYIFRKK